MPELPDVVLYVDALKTRIAGERLTHLRLSSPFVLRSVEPSITLIDGAPVRDIFRIGKRIVLQFGPSTGPSPLFLVLHLMIAGRLRWRDAGRKLGMSPKLLLASFEFPAGTIFFTEASSKKRASMRLVDGIERVRALDPGGLEPFEATLADFREALTRENHTLKRGLTDPHLFSGIGNAYSDEILHAARLSPMKLTRSLSDAESERLYQAMRETLAAWIARLRDEAAGQFPEKVTAFRGGMAVHGRYREPCPVCGAPVQRIVYAENECNYCAKCQTGGRRLADRSLSRLLGDDWPRLIDDTNQ